MSRSVNFLPMVGSPAAVEGSPVIRRRQFAKELRANGACPFCLRADTASRLGVCTHCFEPAGYAEPVVEKWSPGRKLALVVGFCSAVWCLVGGLLADESHRTGFWIGGLIGSLLALVTMVAP